MVYGSFTIAFVDWKFFLILFTKLDKNSSSKNLRTIFPLISIIPSILKQQNGQTHVKNLAANAARFFMCV